MKNHDVSQLVALVRTTFTTGRRVRLLGFGEVEPMALTAGAEGTVALVDSIGTVHVNWDEGVGLGVIVHTHDGRKPDRIQPLGDGPNWPPVR